jgi:hypothetical protein
MMRTRAQKQREKVQELANQVLLAQLIANTPTDEEKDFKRDLITAYIAEYNALRAELLQVQTAQGQVVLAAIVALGVAIPVLSSLLENNVWHSLLIFPLLFSAMALIYSGYIGTSFIISSYINNVLRPAINDVFKQNLSALTTETFYWEKYSHKGTIYWDVLGLRKPAEAVLFTLPGFASTLLFVYLGQIGNFTMSRADWIFVFLSFLQVVSILAIVLVVNSAGVKRIGK